MKKLSQIANYIKSFLMTSKPTIHSNNCESRPLFLMGNYISRQKTIKNEDYKYNFYNSNISEGLNFNKIYCLFGLFSLMIYKKISCYPASDKELEKIRSNLEREIKNLEFKYEGKLRRQPIK